MVGCTHLGRKREKKRKEEEKRKEKKNKNNVFVFKFSYVNTQNTNYIRPCDSDGRDCTDSRGSIDILSFA